jgi:hypothetical protein
MTQPATLIKRNTAGWTKKKVATYLNCDVSKFSLFLLTLKSASLVFVRDEAGSGGWRLCCPQDDDDDDDDVVVGVHFGGICTFLFKICTDH